MIVGVFALKETRIGMRKLSACADRMRCHFQLRQNMARHKARIKETAPPRHKRTLAARVSMQVRPFEKVAKIIFRREFENYGSNVPAYVVTSQKHGVTQ